LRNIETAYERHTPIRVIGEKAVDSGFDQEDTEEMLQRPGVLGQRVGPEGVGMDLELGVVCETNKIADRVFARTLALNDHRQ
jgi:hypothetical protein